MTPFAGVASIAVAAAVFATELRYAVDRLAVADISVGLLLVAAIVFLVTLSKMNGVVYMQLFKLLIFI